jgi:hypothetical protein
MDPFLRLDFNTLEQLASIDRLALNTANEIQLILLDLGW